MMRRFSLLASALALALVSACGKTEDLPQKPQIESERSKLTYGNPITSTCVCAQNYETPALRNGGKDDLKITAVELKQPANLFTLKSEGCMESAVTSCSAPVTVASTGSTWVTVYYNPRVKTAPGASNEATLTITSNAENHPTLELPISTTAVDYSDNSTLCKYLSGQCP
jgi:hypothetical protein